MPLAEDDAKILRRPGKYHLRKQTILANDNQQRSLCCTGLWSAYIHVALASHIHISVSHIAMPHVGMIHVRVIHDQDRDIKKGLRIQKAQAATRTKVSLFAARRPQHAGRMMPRMQTTQTDKTVANSFISRSRRYAPPATHDPLPFSSVPCGLPYIRLISTRHFPVPQPWRRLPPRLYPRPARRRQQPQLQGLRMRRLIRMRPIAAYHTTRSSDGSCEIHWPRSD